MAKIWGLGVWKSLMRCGILKGEKKEVNRGNV